MIETPYGKGRVTDVSPSEITVWIVGRGSYKIAKLRAVPPNEPFLARLRQLASPRSAAASVPSRPAPPRPLSAPKSAQTRALAAIDALRLGTVPRFALREATIGRDQFLAQATRALDETKKTGAGRSLLVTGPNGAGKTHMLPLIEEEALQRGYLVARAELEGALKLTPKMVYQHLVTHLVWIHSGERREGTLEEFFHDHDNDMDKVQLDEIEDSPLVHKLVSDLREANPISEAVWDWVHGDEVYANTLSKTGYKTGWLQSTGTHGQTLSNPMSALARVARDLGYAGLAILLDEAELVLIQDSRWALLGREWLRALVLAAEGGKFASPAGEFAEGQMAEYRNWTSWRGRPAYTTEFRLRYGGLSSYATRRREMVARDIQRYTGTPRGPPIVPAGILHHAPAGRTPLLLVLGYTDQGDSVENVFDEEENFAKAWLPASTIKSGLLRLPEMRKQDIEKLIERLAALYAEAYPKDAAHIHEALPGVADALAAQLAARLRIGTIESIRGASQAILDVLDRLASGYPADRIRRALAVPT